MVRNFIFICLLVCLAENLLPYTVARPAENCDFEKLDGLLNATLPFTDINSVIPGGQSGNSNKMLIPKDVELVPPYDSSEKKGKARGYSLVDAIIGVSFSICDKYIFGRICGND